MSIFDPHVPVQESRDRTGEVYRFDPQIRVPAAVLINNGTRSGKETIAYGIKKHHLAVLVGERTAGAMLPGSPYCLPDGSLLYLATATNTVDGESLEGKGVQPDVPVPFEVHYAEGNDVQLEKAVSLMTAASHPSGGR